MPIILDSRLRGNDNCGLLQLVPFVMIKDFNDIDAIAAKSEPITLVALAADEREFLLTVKKAVQQGYINPCIIGDPEKIRRTAESVLVYPPVSSGDHSS